MTVSRNILPLMAAAVVVALMLAVAACGHGGMAEQAARAAVDTVEAHYKAYATTEADLPLIADAARRPHCRAVDRRTRVRAALYHGAVLDELGRADSALIHYKRAEAACDTADHDLLGYINLRIASLYQMEFASDGEVLTRYQFALDNFKSCKDTHYQLVCLDAITRCYDLTDKNTAIDYADSLFRLAETHNELWYVIRAKSLLAQIHFFKREYLKANRFAVSALTMATDTDSEDINKESLAIAVRTYALLGQPDSASLYLSKLPSPDNGTDSISYFFALAETERSLGDINGYITHYQIGDSIADCLILSSQQHKLREIEGKYNLQQMELDKTKTESRNLYLLLIVLLLVSLLAALSHLLLRHRDRLRQISDENHDVQMQLRHSIANLNQLQQSFKLSESSLLRSKQELGKTQRLLEANRMHVRLLRTISQSISLRKQRNNDSSLSVGGINQDFWDEVFQYANSEYSGIIDHFREMGMAEDSAKFVGLCCLGLSNTIIKTCMGFTNLHYVTNKKAKIAQKFIGSQKTMDEYIAQMRTVYSDI